MVKKKIGELTPLIEAIDNTTSMAQCQKLNTKVTYLIRRIDNIKAKTEVDTKRRSAVLGEVLSLINTLKDKTVRTETLLKKIPPGVAILEQNTSQHTFNEDIDANRRSSAVEDIQQLGTSTGVTKAILPNKWDIKFSDQKSGISVTAFFERTEELRKARHMSKDILLNSGIDLFTGRAYQFYHDCRSEVNTWDELAKMFKDKYQPPDYSERLFEEIKKRTHGADETIGPYLAIMSKYYQRLQCHLSEDVKLKILMRYIVPYYQQYLGLTEIASISELRTVCRKLEERKLTVESFSAPSRRAISLKPDLAYIDVGEQLSALHVSPTTSQESQKQVKGKHVVCYRCNEPGHRAVGCANKGKGKFCYRCKKEGFRIKTCPTCSKNGHQRLRKAE